MAILLNEQITQAWRDTYPPEAQKTLRGFSSQEVADLLGVTAGRLRQLELAGETPSVARLTRGRRQYTLSDVNVIRELLSKKGGKSAKRYYHRRRDGEKMQVIAIANFKGGCAKTTTSLHCAQYLALQGLRVLAIDLDPQASLTESFGIRAAMDVDEMQSLYGVICYDTDRPSLKSVIRKSYFSGLDFVPAHAELNYFEHETPQAIGDPTLLGGEHFIRRIASALETVSDDYDVVILDAPPQLSYMTLNAIFAATGLIIPAQPAMLDVASMSQFLSMLDEMLTVLEESGADCGHDFVKVLITRHNPNDTPQATIAAMLRGLFSNTVLASPVLETTAIANAGLDNKSIYELERGAVGRDTYLRAIDSVNAVNGEIFQLIKNSWGRS
ncbi:plasmid partitioning protein RepA [Cohaesibacter celericrescens]|uniref:Plasmid partitioning protein RepA n=2 Tax=Cohaesibacter celericrescens TaxID=2067669 RepID=A0A2N5XJU0_9HYPH|nr:plasmid partitioning protein RepA [Cohaesibacter celericrescens]